MQVPRWQVPVCWRRPRRCPSTRRPRFRPLHHQQVDRHPADHPQGKQGVAAGQGDPPVADRADGAGDRQHRRQARRGKEGQPRGRPQGREARRREPSPREARHRALLSGCRPGGGHQDGAPLASVPRSGAAGPALPAHPRGSREHQGLGRRAVPERPRNSQRDQQVQRRDHARQRDPRAVRRDTLRSEERLCGSRAGLLPQRER